MDPSPSLARPSAPDPKTVGALASPGAGISVGTLRLAVGLLQTTVGTMMLVAPHQFDSAPYAALQPHLALWGVAFLLTGAALLAAAAFALPAPVEVAAHLLAGSTLALLAYGFALVGGWTGTCNFLALGLGTAAAPFAARLSRRPFARHTLDLLPLVVGVGAALTGLTMLGLPEQFSSPIYDVVRTQLPWLGAAFLAAGLFLLYVQSLPAPPPASLWAAHLAAGAALLTWCLVSSVPLRAWIGMAYYGGFGVGVALLPWIRVRLRRIDPTSLRTRLALALSATAVVPMLAVMPFALDRQEAVASARALLRQQQIASILARETGSYVALHRTAIAGLAADPTLARMAPMEQRTLIQAYVSAWPGLFHLSIVDAAGHVVASAGDLPLTSFADLPVYEDARRTNQPAWDLVRAPQIPRPLLAFAAPLRGPNGEFAGEVAGAMEPVELAGFLNSLSDPSQAFLVDGRGRVIAHPDQALMTSAADLSATIPVAALLSEQGSRGALRYGLGSGQRLAGYARVPESDWGVVAEQPAVAMLAESRAQRDVTFVALVLAVTCAALAGTALAGSLVRPLRNLVDAVDAVAAGSRRAELPRNGAAEVRQLNTAVEEMRRRLARMEAERSRLFEAERTARAAAEAALQEQERLVGRLRDANQQLVLSGAREQELRQQFERQLVQMNLLQTTISHDLRNPLTAVMGQAQLLLRFLSKTGLEQEMRSAEAIVANSRRMNGMIQDLVESSRLEWGQMALDREPTDLLPLMREIVERAIPVPERDRVRLEVPEWLPHALIDPARIERALVNLLTNALKYSPEGSPVLLRAEARDDQIQLSVADQGVGIPAQEIPLLFERYYRATTGKKTEGLGLGLYITRLLVEAHGGRLWVESEVGMGSTFHLTLPL